MSEAFICKTRGAWIDQAKKANDKMIACDAKTMNEFAERDYENFCRLIEAFYVLGVAIEPELMERAQMRPVSELFGVSS